MIEIKDYPPNYQEIISVLGDVSEHNPVFCYGNTIYNPFDRELTKDVIHHESIHARQQSLFLNPSQWYNKYLYDRDFRLACELEAYGEQLLFAKASGVRGNLYEWILERLSVELSGEAYGTLMTSSQAKTALRRYKK